MRQARENEDTHLQFDQDTVLYPPPPPYVHQHTNAAWQDGYGVTELRGSPHLRRCLPSGLPYYPHSPTSSLSTHTTRLPTPSLTEFTPNLHRIYTAFTPHLHRIYTAFTYVFVDSICPPRTPHHAHTLNSPPWPRVNNL